MYFLSLHGYKCSCNFNINFPQTMFILYAYEQTSGVYYAVHKIMLSPCTFNYIFCMETSGMFWLKIVNQYKSYHKVTRCCIDLWTAQPLILVATSLR